MSGTVQEISSAIRDIVAASGQIPGTRLSAALKERSPGWTPSEFGVRSLREFVATHVSGVVVVGRSGMDVIYGLAGSERPSSPDVVQVPSSEPDFWRIWVSPNSPFALVVDRTSGHIKAIRRGGAPADEGQVLLEPPGVDVHRSVAREFLEKVPEELRARLRSSLEQSSDGWWQAWLRDLRGSTHLPSWNSFRRDAFEHRLRSQLSAATTNEPEIERVLATIRDHHLEASPRGRRATSQVDLNRIEVDDLRRLVIEAVRRMSPPELRDLRLPLGVVLDVLASSKSR